MQQTQQIFATTSAISSDKEFFFFDFFLDFFGRIQQECHNEITTKSLCFPSVNCKIGIKQSLNITSNIIIKYNTSVTFYYFSLLMFALPTAGFGYLWEAQVI